MRIIGLFSCAMLILAGCSQADKKPERLVKWGFVLDQTGAAAAGGFGTTSGNYALEKANAALKDTTGIFKGLQFEEVIGDSTNRADVAVERAFDLAQTQGAKAIISTVAGEDLALNGVYYDDNTANDPNVPVLCIACYAVSINNPTVSVPGDPKLEGTLRNTKGWNFRTVTSDKDLARVLINVLMSQPVGGDKNGDQKFKIAVYTTNEPGGTAIAEAIKLTAKGARPDAIVEYVLHDPTMNSASHNWAEDVMNLLDNKDKITGVTDALPDAIIEATYPEYAVYLTGALLKAQSSTRLLHYPGFRLPKAIVVLGDGANGQEGVSQVVYDGVEGEKYAEAQTAANGVPPGLFDTQLVDTRNLIMLAVLHAAKTNKVDNPEEVTGEQVRDSLMKLNDAAGTKVGVGQEEFAKAIELIEKGEAINYDGASGPCDFDAARNVRNKISLWKVENKAFVDKAKFDCVKDASCLPVQ